MLSLELGQRQFARGHHWQAAGDCGIVGPVGSYGGMSAEATPMAETLQLNEIPRSREMVMIAGWRQWADAGSVSSGLPLYLIQQTGAHKIGTISADGFYLFQIPGTHDLVRPVIQFNEGYPESLEIRQNEIFFAGDEQHGVVFFLGDEPHLDIERYIAALLGAARTLGVRRIVTLGGVYGELPYTRERPISAIYSLTHLRDELAALAVEFSDYVGGASISSYLCRRAGDLGIECVGLYAFVPTYDFTEIAGLGNGIRIENDFIAWMGIMRRLNFMLKLGYDLSELQHRTRELLSVMDARIREMDQAAPDAGLRDYFAQLEQDFEEVTFAPLGDVWEEELRKLFDDDEAEDNA